MASDSWNPGGLFGVGVEYEGFLVGVVGVGLKFFVVWSRWGGVI